MALGEIAWRSPEIFEALAATLPRPRYPIRDVGPLREAWGGRGLIPAGFDAERKLCPASRLDNGATTIPLSPVTQAVLDFVPFYGNPHAGHLGAETSGFAVDDSLDLALEYAGAKDKYEAFFFGHGTTGGTNWVSWIFRHNPDPRGRKKVIISGRGHHATLNMRGILGDENVIYVPFTDTKFGRPPTDALLAAIDRHGHEARAVVTTPTDNLMGIFGEADAISAAAHRKNMIHVADGAHDWGHRLGMTIAPFGYHSIAKAGFDVYATSPHKWYAAFSDGLVIARRDLLEEWDPVTYGGGHVKDVSLKDFSLSDNPRTKHSAGTPNVLGAVAMREALRIMMMIGPDLMREHEVAINNQMMQGLNRIAGVKLAGDPDQANTPRAMVWSFIVKGLMHAKGEAWLEDHFAEEFRGGCHCAQPTVATLLIEMMGISPDRMAAYLPQIRQGDRSQAPGLLRPAGALYTTLTDVERFLSAVELMANRREQIDRDYKVLPSGHAVPVNDTDWLERKQAFIQKHNENILGAGLVMPG